MYTWIKSLLKRVIRNEDLLLALTVAVCGGILIGEGIGVVERQYSQRTYEFPTYGRIFYGPYLTLDVSPPGYPIVGEFWRISVYVVTLDSSSRTLTYTPANDSTVVVTLIMGGEEKTFEIPTDDNGIASFQYLSKYTDIAFEAINPEVPFSQGDRVVIRSNFISSNIVDTLLAFNVISGAGSIVSLLVPKLNRMGKNSRRIMKTVLVCDICILAFVMLNTIYSKLFQSTIWGYPENIFGNLITFTLLKQIFYVGIALFLFYWIGYVVIEATNKK